MRVPQLLARFAGKEPWPTPSDLAGAQALAEVCPAVLVRSVSHWP